MHKLSMSEIIESEYNYIPSIELLKRIIEKKKQVNIEKYKYLIGIRHHEDLNFLIDQLINIIVSHFTNEIFISVSLTKEFYEKIPDKLKNICNYINFIQPFNVYKFPGFNDYKYITDHILYNNINYEYFIYHSSSEYYFKDFDCDISLEYTRNENILLEEQIKNSWINKKGWNWTKYFKKCEKTKKLYLDNGMMFRNGQANGIVVPQDVITSFSNFVNENIDTDPSKYKAKNMIEILLPSYLSSYWEITKIDGVSRNAHITNCFWKFSRNSTKIIKQIKKNVLNGTDTYFCVKRCDGHNNQLLKYVHNIYMKDRVRKIISYK
jgi:hypothetical protein